MKVYDLIVKFSGGEIETKTYYAEKYAKKAIKQLRENGYNPMDYKIVEREATEEETHICKAYMSIMNEWNEMEV